MESVELRDLRLAFIASQYRSLRQAAEAVSIRQSTLGRRLCLIGHRKYACDACRISSTFSGGGRSHSGWISRQEQSSGLSGLNHFDPGNWNLMSFLGFGNLLEEIHVQ